MKKIISISVFCMSALFTSFTMAKSQNDYMVEKVECATAKDCILKCKNMNKDEWKDYGYATEYMEIWHYLNGNVQFKFFNFARSNNSILIGPERLNCRILNRK